jgi:hypothetical protein
MKTLSEKLSRKWRQIFRRRRANHDPLLVLNMTLFNLEDGWSRTFSPLKTHETGAR